MLLVKIRNRIRGVNPPNPIPKQPAHDKRDKSFLASGGRHESSIAVRLTLTLTLTLAREFWPQRDKARALTLILPAELPLNLRPVGPVIVLRPPADDMK